MLTAIGKFSAAVVIAAGSLAMRAQPAEAAQTPPLCNQEEQYHACYASGLSSFKQGNEWFCAHYAGDCVVIDGELSWSIMYVSNGQTECPPVLLC